MKLHGVCGPSSILSGAGGECWGVGLVRLESTEVSLQRRSQNGEGIANFELRNGMCTVLMINRKFVVRAS